MTKIENGDKIGYGNNDKSVIDNVLVEKDIRVENLGDNEMGAIKNYVSSDSFKINNSLRNGDKLTIEQQQFVDDLDIALLKSPRYNGDLTRSIQFYHEETLEEFLSNFIIGETISFAQYISTTCGELYNPEAQVLIYITNSKNGRDIREYNEEEQEILYERDSVFEIEDITSYKGKIVIDLREV